MWSNDRIPVERLGLGGGPRPKLWHDSPASEFNRSPANCEEKHQKRKHLSPEDQAALYHYLGGWLC